MVKSGIMVLVPGVGMKLIEELTKQQLSDYIQGIVETDGASTVADHIYPVVQALNILNRDLKNGKP